MTPRPHRQVAAPRERATGLGSYSRTQSQRPKRGHNCLPSFSSSPRAALAPRQQGRARRRAGRPAAHGRPPPAPLPAGGGRGVRSPHLTAPAGNSARQPPRFCRLTSSRAAGATARRDFRLPRRPRPLPPAASVTWGAGPHSRAGSGARGGACRAAGFPPPRAAYAPSLRSPSQTQEDRRLPPGLKIGPRARYESAASPSACPSRPQSGPSTHTFITGH